MPPFADLVIVWARDDEGDVGAFVVEKDAAGFDASTVITGKMGKRAVWQAEIELADVRVPAENRLAKARTFDDATRVLDETRGGAAWECVGHAMAGVEAAVAYAAERSQFGQPIAGFQLVQAKLATVETYEGTDSVQSLILGRDLTGLSAFT